MASEHKTMSKLFQVNASLTYVDDPHVSRNIFLTTPCESSDLPVFEKIRDRLPLPIWEGHEAVLACYDAAWKLAFDHLRKAEPKAGFVSNFIDTAFNGYLFMWDSSFIVQFGKYAASVTDFQKTLDNFYARQHRDGFICRELCETEAGEQFQRDDPSSTGPNILAWAEWDYAQTTGDQSRIAKVFDPLMAYHHWLQQHRTWPNGAYWSTGWACGMDNQPRVPKGIDPGFSHGHMTWMDACMQMLLSAKTLIKMAKLLGREAETELLVQEIRTLESLIHSQLWDEKDHFFYDLRKDGTLNHTKSIGAYWALLTESMPQDRLDPFIAHLENEAEFKRPHRIPSLSAEDPSYQKEGGYWFGGVWAPTTTMVLRGLEKNGAHELAYEIACNTLDQVVQVFEKTGTLWENYAPEHCAPGNPAKPDFVGWTGLIPIAALFESVFGIQALPLHHKLIWRLHRKEKHGILRYPFGQGVLDLVCEARDAEEEEPVITVRCDFPIDIEVIWNDKTKTIRLP